MALVYINPLEAGRPLLLVDLKISVCIKTIDLMLDG